MEPPQKSDFIPWLFRKAVIFIIVTVLFGWFYAAVSPKVFPKNKASGFKLGILHGALMPIALPSLVIGKNVEIYAAHNSGRFYKIGYICGINLCGLAFFGPLFWRPGTRGVQKIKLQ